MEEKKKNGGLMAIIILLVVIIIGLGCALGYFLLKDNNKNNELLGNNIEENQDTKEEIVKQDNNFFEQYLSPFLYCDGWFIGRNTEIFDDTSLRYFISNYYNDEAKKTAVSEELSSLYSNYVEVSATEVKDIIFKYFNKKDIDVSKLQGSTQYGGSVEFDNEKSLVKIYYKSVGCMYVGIYNLVNVEYNENDIAVTYNITDDRNPSSEVKNEIFHLRYNNGNYNLIKIEKQ